MKAMNLMVVTFLLAGLNGNAWSEEKVPAAPAKAARAAAEITPEQRQNMAKMHEQMADCLKSDKSLNECHEQMWKACDSFGNGGCPTMGWGPGSMRHGRMMRNWKK